MIEFFTTFLLVIAGAYLGWELLGWLDRDEDSDSV